MMKKPGIKPVAWAAIALTLYLTSYGVLRSSGQLKNIYSSSDPSGNGIRASTMEWRDMSVKLATEKRVLLGAFEKARSAWPRVLESVFWPLRELEFAFWRATDRYEDSN